MTSSNDSETAQALVQEGWDHFRLQRPLAAWASWVRALGFASDFPPALQALGALEKAPQLPATARGTLKFQPPGTLKLRKRWDSVFKNRALNDLDDAAEVFAALADHDPADDSAWYNHAVCLAWLGENAESIAALNHVVQLRAEGRFEHAVEAWTLAEVLRQGGGSESLADDLAYAWMIDCSDAASTELLEQMPNLQSVPPPLNPATGEPAYPDTQTFTWLDRPMPTTDPDALKVADLPRVLAQVMKLPGRLRLSSPDPIALDRVFANLLMTFGNRIRPIGREATPLPIALLDAAVWTFRLPPGLSPDIEQRLARGAVEGHYENVWVHKARHGLDDKSPLEAARALGVGDSVAKAKLAAVIGVREQLGARTWTANLYHGYPFDRLRARLGLAPVDPETLDPNDYSCLSAAALDQIDPATLEELQLSDAYESAAALSDDRLTARFAAELARRGASSLSRIDAPALIATLVREALKSDAADAAFDWLDQAAEINEGRDHVTFEVWKAELHVQQDDPAAAVAVYQRLLDDDPGNSTLALDAAETLIDHGHHDHARPFLLQARDEARKSGDLDNAHRAELLLGSGEVASGS